MSRLDLEDRQKISNIFKNKSIKGLKKDRLRDIIRSIIYISPNTTKKNCIKIINESIELTDLLIENLKEVNLINIINSYGILEDLSYNGDYD